MSADIIVESPARLATIFARRTVELATEARSRGRRFAIALPGGSVARAFLPALAEMQLDWDRVEWFWGDERAVAADDPESNYAIAADVLFRRVPIPPANVHRMPADAADMDAAAAEYERTLTTVLGDPPAFDLVLLGVGPDGHVCSLFPGHAALDERMHRVIAIGDSPKPPPRRLTLTLPALRDAELHIGAFGKEKAPIIREAVEDSRSRLPVALATHVARRAFFLIDDEAASLLEARG